MFQDIKKKVVAGMLTRTMSNFSDVSTLSIYFQCLKKLTLALKVLK